MQLTKPDFEFAKTLASGLNQNLTLVSGFSNAFPGIDRSHWRQDTHASRESLVDERTCQRFHIAIDRERGQRDEEFVRPHVSSPRAPRALDPDPPGDPPRPRFQPRSGSAHR